MQGRNRSIGRYIWDLLRDTEQGSLFPELFAVFRDRSKYDVIRGLLVHNHLMPVLATVAHDMGIDVAVVEAVFVRVIRGILHYERDDRFELFWEFISIFGGTSIDVPGKAVYYQIIEDATIYHKVVTHVSSDVQEAIRQVAKEHHLPARKVRSIVTRVEQITRAYEQVQDDLEKIKQETT